MRFYKQLRAYHRHLEKVYFQNKYFCISGSLRSKRFREAFRTFKALFAFLAARKLRRARKSAFSRLPSPSPLLPSVLRSPQFLRSQKSEKLLERTESPRKRLLRRLHFWCNKQPVLGCVNTSRMRT